MMILLGVVVVAAMGCAYESVGGSSTGCGAGMCVGNGLVV